MTIRIEVPPKLKFCVRAREQDRRQRRHGGQEQRAGERQAREDAVEEFGRRAARAARRG